MHESGRDSAQISRETEKIGVSERFAEIAREEGRRPP